MKRVLFVIFILFFNLPVARVVEGCEVNRPIVFAELDWQSNAVHTAIARIFLEVGYGCETVIIPGTTIPLLQGVAQGDIDIVMEVWKDNVNKVWNRALKRKQVIEIGLNFSDAIQGWYVPRYLVEGRGALAPDLISVFDLPRYKHLFQDPEEPQKGRFYNCIAGWNCEIINSAKLYAYGLSKHFTNFRPGTSAALNAAIVSAYAQRVPFLTYYWEPTWLLGKYDLVMLEEPEYNKEIFEKLSINFKPLLATSYPVLEVYIGANKKFADQAEETIKFLKNYQTDSKLISQMLYVMEKDKVTARNIALDFIKNSPGYWSSWVDAEIADKVISYARANTAG